MKFLGRLIPLHRRSIASLHAERTELEEKLKANTAATQALHRKFAEDRARILSKIKARSEAGNPIISFEYSGLWSDHHARYGKAMQKASDKWRSIHERLCAVLQEVYKRPPASS